MNLSWDPNLFALCILYADDIVIFANSKEELQPSLDALDEYYLESPVANSTYKRLL